MYKHYRTTKRLGTGKDRKVEKHTLEQALYDCFCDQFTRRGRLFGRLIQEKSKTIQELANERVGENEQLKVKCCKGWLSRLQARWNLKSRRTLKQGMEK